MSLSGERGHLAFSCFVQQSLGDIKKTFHKLTSINITAGPGFLRTPSQSARCL